MGQARRSSWWRQLPMRFAGVAVVAAIAGLGVWNAASRDDSGAITGAGTLHIADVRVGDCFDLNESSGAAPEGEEVGDIRAIPCAEPHHFEAIYAGQLASGPYPTRNGFDTELEARCIPAFETYVGRDYDTSELYITSFEPTPAGWNLGDRGYLCVVSTFDALVPLEDSVRDSGR